ncbi:MAG: DUF3617 family protein [Steroidobacteraceae bacterium]
MIASWPSRASATASLLLLAFAPAQAADPPGILWETTSQMVMEGMPMTMPPQTMQSCAAQEWTKPPPSNDPGCVTSDYRKVGNKVTWTMQCTGQMPMTGSGEITFSSPDAYTGTIKAAAQGMNMTIKLTGRKIGSCDNPT